MSVSLREAQWDARWKARDFVVGVRLCRKLVELLDEKRGRRSRSKWVRELVEAELLKAPESPGKKVNGNGAGTRRERGAR